MGSSSDQLFNKRKRKEKRDYERQSNRLSPRSRVLIVCEGKKTEPLYFKFLIKKLGLTAAEIEISGDIGSAPSSVVNFGKKKIKSDPNFNYVFFVFDKDTHTDYDNALSSINSLKEQRKYRNIEILRLLPIPVLNFGF